VAFLSPLNFIHIKNYIDSLSKCVKQWFYIFNIQYSNHSDRIKEHIQKLERVGWGAFPPMIMAVFTKETNEDLIWNFLDACERFNFLVFAVSHRSSNTQNSNLYRKTREYYMGQLDIETITADIDFLTDGEDDENYYGWFDLERFKNHIKELFSKNDREGFYSWSGLRYFLYEYELYLQDNANMKVSWEDFNKRKKEDTIEHIYPQSPNDIYWKNRFGHLKPSEKRQYLNSLGNLLLLNRSKNSKLQNYDFDKKKCLLNKDGKEIGYYNGSYSEILCTFNDNEGINYGQKSEWIDRFLYRSYNQLYKSFVFGYEKDNPSDEYFKTKILEQESSAADKYPETLYTANLMFAKEYFKNRLKSLSKEDKEAIFDKAINRLKFNYYEIDDSLDVYVTFETMNNRGKDLSHLELLKNRLIYLSTLLHEDDETKGRLRTDINETWKTIYEYLGKNKDNPLDDDDFLFNHWIMYFTYDRSQSDVYAEFLLKKKFTAKNVLSGNISIKEISNDKK
jgi:hypothetical protein